MSFADPAETPTASYRCGRRRRNLGESLKVVVDPAETLRSKNVGVMVLARQPRGLKGDEPERQRTVETMHSTPPNAGATHPGCGFDGCRVGGVDRGTPSPRETRRPPGGRAVPRDVDRGELARAGVLGLVEAACRYDEVRGVPFERFAAQRIRGAILDAVRAVEWAPRSTRTLARQLEQHLAAELGRMPDNGGVAEALDMSRDELDQLQHRMFRSVVLTLKHATTHEVEKGLALVDLLADNHSIEPSSEFELRELHSYLRDVIRLLPDRHRLVVVGSFLEGRTSQELANFLGVTVSRISQLRSEALLMLQEGIDAQYAGKPFDLSGVSGRVARRKATFAEGVAASSAFTDRMEEINLSESDAPGLAARMT